MRAKDVIRYLNGTRYQTCALPIYGNKFKNFSLKLLPPKFRKDANQILLNMDTQVGAYIQGQIIVALCIGLLLYIGYLIFGLDYAIILALIVTVSYVVLYLCMNI